MMDRACTNNGRRKHAYKKPEYPSFPTQVNG